MILLCVLLAVGCVQAQRLTNRKIGQGVKDKIMSASSNADAYNKYMEVYTDLEDSPPMASIDPVTLQATRARQQKAFIGNLRKCKAQNRKFKKGRSKFECTVNSFSIMDKETKKQFLGLSSNMSLLQTSKYRSAPKLMAVRSLQALPNSWDWREKGVVTAVKNQGSCGSCWTYAAIGPIEYAYKMCTGNLLSFSEQELLDCAYENSRDGCNGGWYTNAWDFVIEDNHLSSESNYPYQGSDGTCSHSSHVNSLANKVRINGYAQSQTTEAGVLNDLVNQMPLAVAFTVEDNFYPISSGIYDGCAGRTSPNHAVILTGYGQDYFEIKNSWGSDWGEDGYGKLERGRNVCGILSYVYYIKYTDLDSSDFEEDQDEDEGESEADDSDCVDLKDNCASWAASGYCAADHEYYDYVMGYCRYSCSDCTCADIRHECGTYLDMGYCTTQYVDWMALNCPVTCGYCTGCDAGSYTTSRGCVTCPAGSWSAAASTACTDCPSGQTSPAGSTSQNSCISSDCDAGYYWSSSSCIICPENTWSSSGASSCTTCSSGKESSAGSTSAADCKISPGGSCTDDNDNCPNWAGAGYCTSGIYVSYMQLNCKKSCDLCEACEDKEADCSTWAEYGYCASSSIYNAYMTWNCPESCELCGDTEETCGGGLTRCSDGVCRHVHLC